MVSSYSSRVVTHFAGRTTCHRQIAQPAEHMPLPVTHFAYSIQTRFSHGLKSPSSTWKIFSGPTMLDMDTVPPFSVYKCQKNTIDGGCWPRYGWNLAWRQLWRTVRQR